MAKTTVKRHTRQLPSGKTVTVRSYERTEATDVIYFPKAEHAALAKRLAANKDIYTTRISSEKDRYEQGDRLQSPLGVLKVRSVKQYKRLSNHPYLSELTPEQKKQLTGQPFALVQLYRDADAPGLPDKKNFADLPEVTAAQHWEAVVQEHDAKRRGKHLDLRFGRGGKAYSWALREWPQPGSHTWAIEQPVHTQEYMKFEGPIVEGYGAGEVTKSRAATAVVHYASPNMLKATLVDGKKTEDVALIRIKDRIWRLVNFTSSSDSIKPFQHKPKYRKTPVAKLDAADDSTVWSAKIDGAHGILKLQGGKRPRVFSYRVPKAGGQIEWTHKIPGLFGTKLPASLGDTVLRVEVAGQVKGSKKFMRPEEISGLLNANVIKSLEKQRTQGALRPYLIDVIRYKGKDMADAPGEEKIKLLKQLQKRFPYFGVPDSATNKKGKLALLKRIKAKKHPQTDEGIVEIPLGQGPFRKGKILEETDVYVRDFFAAKKGSKYEDIGVGGFTYSLTPNGPVEGRVGTGLTDKLRKDMYNDPEKFKGSVAMVRGQRFSSGKQRVPAFIGWHPDFAAVKDVHKDLKPPRRS